MNVLIKINIKSVQKVYSHFEYLKNWKYNFHVTWQPIRGVLVAYAKQVLSRGVIQSAVRCH